MKKIILPLAVTCFVTQVFSQALSVSNGGFETGGTINCSSHVNNATDWHSLKTTYDIGSCGTTTDTKDAAGAYTWENADACTTGAASYAGSRYAEAEYSGDASSGGATAYNNLIYQQMTNNASSNTCYKAIAYVKSIAGLGVSGMLGIFFVNTSVGSGAAAIMGDLRSQTLSSGTFTSVGSGWYKMEVDWTPPSTSTYYIIIGNAYGDLCDDSNPQTNKWILDEVSIVCRANAGTDKANLNKPCCTPACTAVQIGTSQTCSDMSYSWSPTSTLSCSTCQQPNASPCSTTNYTLTVSSSYCTTATDVVTVTTAAGGPCDCGGAPAPRLGVPSTVDPEVTQDVSIYPNPTNGLVTITVGDGTGTAALIKITDMLGKTVFEKSNASKTISVDLSNYPNGNYSIAITDGQNHIVKNMIKE